jgi:protein-S-isoprenylcysteine O-methyltransferase Ste14
VTWKNSLSAAAWMTLMGVALFVPAGTVTWTGAWIFLAEMIFGSIASIVWLAKRDPALLKERLSGPIQKGQTFWDKVFMLTMIAVWYGWMALMALDVGRWRISHAPDWGTALGAALIPLGFLAVLRTFRENTFAAPVIRIQDERGQTVIDTGPYAVMRHPMYAGALLYMLGTPLVLGSWIGLAALPLIVGFLIVRIFIEERTLREGLSGYADYAKRVRYRLIPGVW